MKTVVLEVRSLDEALADAARAMTTGRASRETRVGFATPELLWRVLTAKRWELLKALCGAGPISVREAARRVGRDVKAVHGDVTALAAAGLVDRDRRGRVEFPFDAVKVDSCCRRHRTGCVASCRAALASRFPHSSARQASPAHAVGRPPSRADRGVRHACARLCRQVPAARAVAAGDELVRFIEVVRDWPER